ncbi:MAG TPA: ThuA domain-containing protein [Humisphaera sp.]|jgi:hypothetical protein|nr:ThuA domain-containing protein [Humisphaera sp.]
MLNRRAFLTRTGAAAAALGLARFPLAWGDDASPKRKLLFFTKSSGFEHSSIKRKSKDELSHAEQVVTDLGAKHNFDVTCTKDGRIFVPDKLAAFDAFMFYTTGDLTEIGTDRQPPMSKEGKQAFLDLIKEGKGFIGTHSASDTFHSPGNKAAGTHSRFVQDGDNVDPYIAMLSAEFIVHGAQQKAHMTVADKNFPGMAAAGDGFDMLEEWYTLKDHAKNLHVLLIQEPGLKGNMYDRPAYPATWAREHGKGRVFYTSMGHREEVWLNPIFQSILLGGLSWAFGNVKADVTPNIEKVTPQYLTLGKEDPPKAK